MLAYAFDRFLPRGLTWRGLFDLVIVEARKPAFFSGRQAVYRLADEERGWLEPHRGPLAPGGAYVGGDASLVEASLELSGAQILYLGDHLFGDVHVSKQTLRWRTGLILRELEPEIRALEGAEAADAELRRLMARKEELDGRMAHLRLARQRGQLGYGPPPPAKPEELDAAIQSIGQEIQALDSTIGPLAKASGETGNPTWGPLMRAGYDKSLFARQVERYADVYTSRVSNFLAATPFAYLRAARTSLPHDPA
jgi:hypothetical protein